MLKILTKSFFYLLVLTPLIGYIVRGLYEIKVAGITLIGNFAILLTGIIILNFGFSKLKTPKYFTIGLLVAIYIIIWGLTDENPEYRPILKLIFANQALLILFVFIVIENTHFSDSFIKQLIFLFKVTIIASFIVSLIQLLVDPYFFTPANIQEETDYFANIGTYEVRNRSIYGFLDQNDLGLSFIPILALFMGYHFYEKNKKHIQFIVFIIMGGLVCFLTNGRYIIVNYIIIFFQLLLLKTYSFPKKFRYIMLSLILLGIVVSFLSYFGYDLNKFWNERIMSESGNSRIVAFDVFGKLFPEHPIFGSGARTTEEMVSILYGRSSQIHVGYLSALFEWGIVGGLLIFTFWFKIIKDLYSKAKKSMYFGALFGFITFLVANTVLVQYYILFYGLIFCFVFSKYYYNKAGYDNEKHLIYI